MPATCPAHLLAGSIVNVTACRRVTAQGVDQPHDALGDDRGRHRGGAEAELEPAETPGPQALDEAQRADEHDRHAAQGQDQ